jgi:hypothetical protein
MMDILYESLMRYYGLDWIAFMSGLSGMVLITRKLRIGFVLSAISCIAGVAASVLSAQFGYVLYNMLLVFIMAHGYLFWSSSDTVRQETKV